MFRNKLTSSDLNEINAEIQQQLGYVKYEVRTYFGEPDNETLHARVKNKITGRYRTATIPKYKYNLNPKRDIIEMAIEKTKII